VQSIYLYQSLNSCMYRKSYTPQSSARGLNCLSLFCTKFALHNLFWEDVKSMQQVMNEFFSCTRTKDAVLLFSITEVMSSGTDVLRYTPHLLFNF